MAKRKRKSDALLDAVVSGLDGIDGFVMKFVATIKKAPPGSMASLRAYSDIFEKLMESSADNDGDQTLEEKQREFVKLADRIKQELADDDEA